MFAIVVILSFFVFAYNSFATVFKVGPDLQYTKPSEVMPLVNDGDTVLIEAALYEGDAGIWRKNNLLIKGTDGVAHLKARDNLPQGKAIWIVQGDNCTIENIKFTDAKVPDKNGAGIRFEGTNLTVRHCSFLNNEDGILAGANPNSTITVEFSEFGYNGYGNGFSHNIYIGNIKKFVFRFNYTHHAKTGHCIKSRAAENIILHNRIMDEDDGRASYLINLPNGGRSYIAGNLLMQSPFAQNSKMIDYGSEGYKHTDNSIFIYNNTLVNKRNPGIYVWVVRGSDTVKILNNIFAGYSANSDNALPSFADTSNNYHTSDIPSLAFADENNFDYHLTAESPVIDRGTAEISIPGYENFLQVEYKHPADSSIVTIDNAVDIGAYQFQKHSTNINEPIKKIKAICSKGLLIIPDESKNSSSALISIYDLRGVLIKNEIIKAINRSFIINVGQLSNGIYLYLLFDNGKEIKGVFYKQ